MPGEGSKPKVLMIDDEEEIVRFFGEVFQNYEHVEFLEALCGRDGVEIAKREKPQVIILDLKMPDISGEQVLDALDGVLPETKFIVVTGQGDVERKAIIEEKTKLAGFYAKPVDFESMVSKILSLLDGEKTGQIS